LAFLTSTLDKEKPPCMSEVRRTYLAYYLTLNLLAPTTVGARINP
jgi:hypothetical protein